MKRLILVFLIAFSYTAFCQETVIKEERKTKVEGNHFKEKIVKTEEAAPVKTEVKAHAATHAAYRPTHVHHVYPHRAFSHRTHRHHSSRAVVHRKHYHKKAAHRHYKEMKKKHSKGKTKIKYEY